MRIGEITNSAEYRRDEQNQNLPIFGIKLWFSRLKKNSKHFPNFTISKIIEFSLLRNKKNYEISKIVECQRLANFRNFKIANIKITKDEIFDSFIIKFIFSFFRNYLNSQDI